MSTHPDLLSFFRYINILLISTFFLPSVLPVTLVHAHDGDFTWSMGFGGEEVDQGHGVFIDTSGNVYTTGTFSGTVDFDPGPEISNLTSAGEANAIFISKFDSSGNFIWAKAIGGQQSCIGYGISVDALGNVYTTGLFWNIVDFDPGAGTFNLTSAGVSDIFISKLDSSGNFVWAKALGGNLWDVGYGLSIDTAGNVLVTGNFQGIAYFDPGSGASEITSTGDEDIFISKFDSSGDFIWVKAIGGESSDRGYGISVDTPGNVYTTGYFRGSADFDPGSGTFNLSSKGENDIFISKLDSNGDFVWAKSIGGSSFNDEGNGIFVDISGNVYTVGNFRFTVDFDPGTGISNLVSVEGSQDIFVSKLDSEGDFVWAKTMGGTWNDVGYAIFVDTSGYVYTTGFFQTTADFDPGTETFNLISVGQNDIFISKLDSSGDFVWAKAMGGTIGEYGRGISVDTSENVYMIGYFQGTVDFDPGAGTFNLTSAGSDDIFIAHLSGPPVISGGDINGDGTIDLADVITTLQVMTGAIPEYVYQAADIDSDGKIGLAEAIFALYYCSGG